MSRRVVDAFIRRYAAPVLNAAGCRSRGRIYVFDGPLGRQGVFGFHADVDAHRTAVELTFGVTTPAHREFRQSRGLSDNPFPHANFALVHRKFWSPTFAREGALGPTLPQQWLLGDEERNARVGSAFAEGLQEEVLPQIHAWFDPETMALAVANPPWGVFCGVACGPRAHAIALLDVAGAERQLSETLARLPEDDMVRRWVEERLAGSTPTR